MPKPNPSCWHPEGYSWRDVMATEDQVIQLVASLIVALQPKIVVEVGSYEGDTARAIGEALARNGRGHLHTVEIDADRANTARSACMGLPVTIYREDAATWTPPSGVQFAWIDGKSAFRERDARRVMEYCVPGAIIGLHDTAQSTVARQVRNLRLREVLTLPTYRGVTFARI